MLVGEKLLSSYPRQRPELPPAYHKIYFQEIQINRVEKGRLFYRLLGWLEHWMHKQVGAKSIPGNVLEIGAGTLNHIPYEPTAENYDIVEPMKALYANNPNRAKVRSAYSDISEVS